MMDSEALDHLRAQFASDQQYKEIWAETEDGQAMAALINGDTGWLVYLREEGDAGFSSRNPAYTEPEDAIQDYYLSNGQCDEYPLAWALPVSELQRAMEHLLTRAEPAPWIWWHNDSDDGVEIDSGS